MSTALSFKTGGSSANFTQAGQNQYRPLRRKRQTNDNVIDFSYFANSDKRMGFESTKDPAYIAFEHIDGLPLHTVVREMAKETIKDLQKIDLRTSIESLMKRR